MSETPKEPYEPPAIVTYTDQDLIEELGPAQTCSPFNGAVISC
jgi:hypothetical protein